MEILTPNSTADTKRGDGGGECIAGMYSKKPYMIPVNPHATLEEKSVTEKQITPVAAGIETAK